MTNYNERLDAVRKIIRNAIKADPNYDEFIDLTGDMGIYDIESRAIADVKQLIASLIKELVAEAKPEEHIDVYTYSNAKTNDDIRKIALNQYEHNLLKALEEGEQ